MSALVALTHSGQEGKKQYQYLKQHLLSVTTKDVGTSGQISVTHSAAVLLGFCPSRKKKFISRESKTFRHKPVG